MWYGLVPSHYRLNGVLLPAVRLRTGKRQADKHGGKRRLALTKKKSCEVSSTSIKTPAFAVFKGHSEDGKENFFFHLSSIKFTSGVIFNKAKFSANKAALLKIKRALLTSK